MVVLVREGSEGAMERALEVVEVADYGERWWTWWEVLELSREALKGEREKSIGESRGEVSTQAKKLILALRGEREKKHRRE